MHIILYMYPHKHICIIFNANVQTYLVLGHEHKNDILSRNNARHPDTGGGAIGWDKLVRLQIKSMWIVSGRGETKNLSLAIMTIKILCSYNRTRWIVRKPHTNKSPLDSSTLW